MPEPKVVSAHLTDLATAGHRIIPSLLGVFRDAARLRLEEAGHTSGVDLKVEGDHDLFVSVHWEGPPPPFVEFSFQTKQATEHGAVGLALILANKIFGQVAVDKAYGGSGFDYWLGAGPLFQNAARLEVSGIQRATNSEYNRRVREKLAQTERSAETGLPAIAAIIEFGAPRSCLKAP